MSEKTRNSSGFASCLKKFGLCLKKFGSCLTKLGSCLKKFGSCLTKNSFNVNRIFLAAITVAGLLWAVLFYLNPDGVQLNIFNKSLDTLFSDFNCVRTNSVEGYFGTSQESKDLCYPALGPTMALLFPFTKTGAAAFTVVGALLWLLSLTALFAFRNHDGEISLRKPWREISLRNNDREISLRNHDREISLRNHDREISLRKPWREISLRNHEREISLRNHEREISLRNHDGEISLRKCRFLIQKLTLPLLFLTGCLLSQISVHAIQWGNQILYAIAGVTLFIAWHDSDSVIKRRIAAIGLATGVALKISPAIFAVIYVFRWVNASSSEKDSTTGTRREIMRDFIFFSISSFILFFVPFAWYGGISGFLKWMSNAAENANYYESFSAWGTVPAGRTIRILLKVPDVVNADGVVSHYAGLSIERAISVIIGLSCFVKTICLSAGKHRSALHLNNSKSLKELLLNNSESFEERVGNEKENGYCGVSPRVLMLLVGAMLLIPGNMHTYTGLYLIPVLALQMRRGLTLAEGVCWFAFLNPLQIPVCGGCVNHPIANVAFLMLLGMSLLRDDRD